MADLGELKLDEKFTDINPDELSPELKETYKNMQSHFTKRVTEAVDSKKNSDEMLGVFTTEKATLEKELSDLKLSNTQLQTSLSEKSGGDDDDILGFLNELGSSDGDKHGMSDEVVGKLTSTITSLTKKVEELEGTVEEKTSKALKIIQYEHDLTTVSESHQEAFDEKLDRQKLIDFAIEAKTPDLHQAYEAFTRERTIEKKAGERAEVMFKERMDKDESFTSGLGVDVPVLFARDEKTPKTMSEATKGILKEIRSKV